MKSEKPISPLIEKSYQFAIKIVHLSQSLISVEREYVLSKQIIRSGTSIGALVRESEFAASRADFINKLTVALKEANETEYWLMILLLMAHDEKNEAGIGDLVKVVESAAR